MWKWISLSSRFPDSKRWSVIIGAVLIGLPVGLDHCYGNLSIYTDSYFLHKEGDMNFDSGSSMWFISLMIISCATGDFSGGLLAKRIGARTTVVLSSVVFNVAVFMTYFAVQRSFWYLTFTYGVCCGFCSGLGDVIVIQYAAVWFPENVAVVTSIVTSAYTIGALMINLIITLYINPSNKAPDFHTERSTYFTDEDILRRVPFVFLVIGVVSSVCQIVGVILLKPRPGASTFGITDRAGGVTDAHNEASGFKYSKEPNERENILHYVSDNNDIIIPGQDSDEQRKPDLPKCRSSPTVGQLDLTTRQILATSKFYKIAVTFAFIMFSMTVTENFYKLFGMLYIDDDYFLSSIGGLNNVTTCVCRLIWGFIVKTIGPQNSYVLMSSVNAILFVFWFFTPMVNKWLFLFWTLAIQAVQNGIIVSTTILVLNYFGSTHYMNNYGAVYISSAAVFVLAPPVVNSVLVNFGYFWLFLIISLANCLCLVLALTLPPTL